MNLPFWLAPWRRTVCLIRLFLLAKCLRLLGTNHARIAQRHDVVRSVRQAKKPFVTGRKLWLALPQTQDVGTQDGADFGRVEKYLSL